MGKHLDWGHNVQTDGIWLIMLYKSEGLKTDHFQSSEWLSENCVDVILFVNL